MAEVARPSDDTSELVKAYQRPYHPPIDAGSLLQALGCSTLVNVWPFRDTWEQDSPVKKVA
jgi:hypothetical protein